MLASIIISNYNYGGYLAEAIESALEQSRAAGEIIVVDDGSTDHSVEVARRYPVRLLAREHEGAQRTMAAGIGVSTGDCFVHLSSDDRLAPNYLETTMPFLERDSAVGFVYTAVTRFGTIHDFVPARRFTLARLLATNYVHGSSLIRRAAYEQSSGLAHMDLAVYEDWNLILDIVELGWRAARTNDTTLYYRQHGVSRNTTGGEAHERAIRDIMTAHSSLYRPSPRIWYWLHRNLYRRSPQPYIALALAACALAGREDC